MKELKPLFAVIRGCANLRSSTIIPLQSPHYYPEKRTFLFSYIRKLSSEWSVQLLIYLGNFYKESDFYFTAVVKVTTETIILPLALYTTTWRVEISAHQSDLSYNILYFRTYSFQFLLTHCPFFLFDGPMGIFRFLQTKFSFQTFCQR